MDARVAFLLLMLTVLAGCGSSSSTAAEPFRVLVTNDDGVAGEGMSVLVETLRANANIEVLVYAPSTNQTGSGDAITTGRPLSIMPSATVAGFPATAVDGEPADCVLFALLQGLDAPPDLVVSGINFGQNIGEFVYLSGTVGATRWAARLGVPAIAVSLGFPATNYSDAAEYAASLVERFRTDAAFRRALDPPDLPEALILNVNYPTCTAGRVRGVEIVPVGRTTQVVGYTLVSEAGDTQTFQPQVETTSAFASDCTSTRTDPSSDVEAMANGFAAVTPIGPDLTQETALASFGFLERL